MSSKINSVAHSMPDARLRWRRARTVLLAPLIACALLTVGAGYALADTGWEGFGPGVWPPASWRPYAPTSPFNLTTEGAAVHPNSAAIVKAVLSWGPPANLVDKPEAVNDWAHPTYYSQSTDPLYTLHVTEPWGANKLNGMKIPIPEAAQPAAGSDGHMTVVTPDGWEYDFWRAQPPPKGGGTFTFAWGGRTRIDGNGLDSGGTASGFGNLAGMIRAQELAAGQIDHALFIVVKCVAADTSFGDGAAEGTSSSSYVYPASNGGSACPETPNLPPMGARFMLAMSDAQIQELAIPAWKKTILTALANYGGYVGDTGGAGFGFMFEDSTMYTSLGYEDPLAAFALANEVPTWEGQYVFEMAGGVEWEKYLRVLVPPAPAPPLPQEEEKGSESPTGGEGSTGESLQGSKSAGGDPSGSEDGNGGTTGSPPPGQSSVRDSVSPNPLEVESAPPLSSPLVEALAATVAPVVSPAGFRSNGAYPQHSHHKRRRARTGAQHKRGSRHARGVSCARSRRADPPRRARRHPTNSSRSACVRSQLRRSARPTRDR